MFRSAPALNESRGQSRVGDYPRGERSRKTRVRTSPFWNAGLDRSPTPCSKSDFHSASAWLFPDAPQEPVCNQCFCQGLVTTDAVERSRSVVISDAVPELQRSAKRLDINTGHQLQFLSGFERVSGQTSRQREHVIEIAIGFGSCQPADLLIQASQLWAWPRRNQDHARLSTAQIYTRVSVGRMMQTYNAAHPHARDSKVVVAVPR
jgi:hypothetical protein